MKELSYAVAMEGEPLTLDFATSNKPPDLSHELWNGTEVTLIASGHRTTEVSQWRIVTKKAMGGGGYHVTMSSDAVDRRIAGTLTASDDDDAADAHKSQVDIIVVKCTTLMSTASMLIVDGFDGDRGPRVGHGLDPSMDWIDVE